MITLKEFKKAIQTVKNFENAQRKLTKILLIDSIGFVEFGDNILDLTLTLLGKVFKTDDPDLLSWWIYEDEDKIIYMPNGEKYDIGKIEDLYYYISGNFEKVKKIT